MAEKKFEFINPYNFVPVDFSKKIDRTDIGGAKRTNTGVLKCKLIAKTPIAIPDTAENPVEKGHATYPFFMLNGVPTIPGSTLRGVFRSEYETITDSCFVTSKPNQQITFRASSSFKPGIVKKDCNGFHLYEAKRYIFAVESEPIKDKDGKPKKDKFGNNMYVYSPFDKCPKIKTVKDEELTNYQYGQKVYFTTCKDNKGNDNYSPLKGKNKPQPQLVGYYVGNIRIPADSPKAAGEKEGLICIGEPFENKKHFESIFEYEREVDLSSCTNNLPDAVEELDCQSRLLFNCRSKLSDAVEELDRIIEIYNDDKINIKAKEHKFYVGRKYSNLSGVSEMPVWYRIENRYIYLSVGALGRSAYGNTMGDKLIEKKPCKSRKEACPACQLFGLIGEGEEAAAGSRVRVGDAVCVSYDENKMLQKRITLKELSGPKPSYIPFYVRNKNGLLNSIEKGKISYDNPDIELRGRKYYWHNLSKDAYKTNEKTERNATMDLIGKYDDSGILCPVEFRFSVFFDGISDDELERLKWVLTLGSNDENDRHCHKIGHGKPIGLGSAKVIIEEEHIRSFDNNKYESHIIGKNDIKIKDFEKANNDGNVIKDAVDKLLIITDLDACKKTVCYPHVVDENGKPFDDAGKNNKHASHQWFSDNFKLGKVPKRELGEIPYKAGIESSESEKGVGETKEYLELLVIRDDSKEDKNKHEDKKKNNNTPKSAGNDRSGFEIGKIYKGKVTGYNKTGKFAQVELSDINGRASFYDEKHSFENKTISLKYKGKDDNGFDKWELQK